MLAQRRRLYRLADRLALPHNLSLQAACSIQKLATDQWADQVAGWKIGRLPASVSGPGATQRFIGPIFTKSVRRLSGPVSRIPILNASQNTVEAEFIVRFVKPLDSVKTMTNENFWLEHIAVVYTGVELAGNDLEDSDRSIAFAQVAAFGNNCGLLIGDQIPLHRYRWRLGVAQ